MMGRDGGAWTAPDDNGFGRVGTEWVQFQPSGDLEFLGPQNLAAITGSTTAAFSWTDRDQVLVPTHTQLRVTEVTPVYTEYEFGTLVSSIAALTPATEYQLQIRYVIRSTDDGSVERISTVSTLFFTTDAADKPSLPAPDPAGPGTGPGSVVTFPPIGGGTGHGPGGPGDTCTFEYIVQQIDTDFPELVIWEDTAVTATGVAGSAEVPIDFIAEGFACGQLVRFKFREVCSSSGNGEYEFSDAFLVPCDWGTTCGGGPINAAFANGAWLDATFALFNACVREGEQVLLDHIGGQSFGKLDNFLATYHNGDNWELFSESGSPTYGGPLVAGFSAGLVSIVSGADFSLTMGTKQSVQPPALGGTKITVAGDIITVRLMRSGAGFVANVYIPCEGGDFILIEGTTVMSLDVQHQITVVIDSDGLKQLYVNGAIDQQSISPLTPRFGDFKNTVACYAGPSSSTSLVGGWDRVLTANEVAGLVAEPQVVKANQGLSSISMGDVEPGDVLLICQLGFDAFSGPSLSVPSVSGPAKDGSFVISPKVSLDIDVSGSRSDMRVYASVFTAAGACSISRANADHALNAVIVRGTGLTKVKDAIGRVHAKTSYLSGAAALQGVPAKGDGYTQVFFMGGRGTPNAGAYGGGIEILSMASEPGGRLTLGERYNSEGFQTVWEPGGYSAATKNFDVTAGSVPLNFSDGGIAVISIEVSSIAAPTTSDIGHTSIPAVTTTAEVIHVQNVVVYNGATVAPVTVAYATPGGTATYGTISQIVAHEYDTGPTNRKTMRVATQPVTAAGSYVGGEGLMTSGGEYDAYRSAVVLFNKSLGSIQTASLSSTGDGQHTIITPGFTGKALLVICGGELNEWNVYGPGISAEYPEGAKGHRVQLPDMTFRYLDVVAGQPIYGKPMPLTITKKFGALLVPIT